MFFKLFGLLCDNVYMAYTQDQEICFIFTFYKYLYIYKIYISFQIV